MKRWFAALNILAVLAGGLTVDAAAARRLDFEVTVRERDAQNDSTFVLIEKRLLSAVEDIKTTAFIVNFTLDLTATLDDSDYFQCNLSLFTLGPQAQSFFKEFRSQAGGILFLEGVRGKGETVYRVGISPVSVDSAADMSDCTFDYRKDGLWNFDPAAHFDFYYVPHSLGDARWNILRDFVEDNYKDFKELFQLNYPGKSNYFFAPCLLPEVVWDQRMGYAIDPPRNNVFALYSHEHNTVDPVPGCLVRIYRFMGYAPPLLAEGLAGYLEFPHFYAQGLLRQNQLPPPSAAVKSIDYFRLPGLSGFSSASSFVKFLIDTRGWTKFAQLYRDATDLNLPETFAQVYGVSFAAAEKEWRQMLDTLTITEGRYQYYYQREQFLQRRAGMDQFLAELRKRMDTYDDSTYVLAEEGWNLYMRGDYVPARADYGALLKLQPQNSNHLIVYGNLLLIDGQYDSARAVYEQLLRVDSTAKTALYKTGESYYWENRPDSAEKYFLEDLNSDPSQLSRSSAAIMLGEMMLARHDSSSAKYYYQQALELMEQVAQQGKTRPSFLLRLGQAHMGLAQCGESSLATARSYLESALYFEVHPTRVIFVTRILLELGRLSDLEGKRQEAIEYYQRTLSYPLPPDQEKQVRAYVVTPFSGYGT